MTVNVIDPVTLFISDFETNDDFDIDAIVDIVDDILGLTDERGVKLDVFVVRALLDVLCDIV
jgi:hypothetical protein